MNSSRLNIPENLKVTSEQFALLAAANRDVQIELTATGQLIIMPPTGGNTGKRNIDIEGQLWFWNRQAKLGVAFNSSTAFKLPNGAERSPDAAWVIQDRWSALTPEEQDTFPPLCPDFAIELRSKSDNIEPLRKKMREYIDNGLRLGWLIDTKNKRVEIYRANQPVEVVDNPTSLSGEDVLPGFILDLQAVFS
ncbi:Uma2 family endonuclease [Aetokthonos hydrillicola Thurmond2011]|jgi:Uma2 family endonuclease|uniref:Uma2 family endonuclease n=1 Tax=Aetokthonos hydrillicola Thurmond2011 TaxID=2712845 RepID=A0AAP5MDV1_9CYAN|nr:Uma2 family endonuclease [Aetokthonos hydrillicola]MBO3457246.1 Uma2 family endonuclease [Aetokthonos hydrillicola CCALA 1050]MBW4586587.1 Uma2 family endonuclease [Aetokthonos hydrillicola CCALA 1050]MDR9900138.1 Uma2 family endonuclease [Aetokthonos hydrillicola Thurmond2011]